MYRLKKLESITQYNFSLSLNFRNMIMRDLFSKHFVKPLYINTRNPSMDQELAGFCIQHYCKITKNTSKYIAVEAGSLYSF